MTNAVFLTAMVLTGRISRPTGITIFRLVDTKEAKVAKSTNVLRQVVKLFVEQVTIVAKQETDDLIRLSKESLVNN